MNAKKDFVVRIEQLVFWNKHKICGRQELVWPKSPLLNSKDD